MTDINADAWVSSNHRPMGFAEFVIVIASIMALNPLAMDMMLPALPTIASAFHIDVANRPQAVLSTFLIGFGVGQFAMGPLSDRFGRRPVLLGGMAVYCVASLLAIAAQSFETLLLARALQGLGTSATALGWSALRMPETLPVSERKSLAIRDVLGAFRQTVTDRQTLGYALAAGGVQGSLFAFVFSSQQIFTEVFKLGHYFPLAFAAIAIGVAVAGFLNSRFVGRLGMRVISHGALVGFVVVAGLMLVAAKTQMLPLPLFMALAALMMFAFGLMFANFTALAMEPQGHIAGTASSLYGSITTLLGIGIGTTIGQDYDGTLLPFASGFFLCTLAALAVVLVVEKGRLFRPQRMAV